MSFDQIVVKELQTARLTYAPINSLHEGYAVILEEVKEFETQVFRKPHERNVNQILLELAQIAAMCQRTAEDCLLMERDQQDNALEFLSNT
jgi:hypothetical protein